MASDAHLNLVPDYVRRLADQLMLKDWTFHIDAEDERPDAYATVRVVGGNEAAIWVHSSFWDLDPEAQRQTLIHELCHCHMWQMHIDELVVDLQLGSASGAALVSTHRRGEEHAADIFSRLLAPAAPLPPWAGSGRSPDVQEAEPPPVRTRRKPKK